MKKYIAEELQEAIFIEGKGFKSHPHREFLQNIVSEYEADTADGSYDDGAWTGGSGPLEDLAQDMIKGDVRSYTTKEELKKYMDWAKKESGEEDLAEFIEIDLQSAADDNLPY